MRKPDGTLTPVKSADKIFKIFSLLKLFFSRFLLQGQTGQFPFFFFFWFWLMSRVTQADQFRFGWRIGPFDVHSIPMMLEKQH